LIFPATGLGKLLNHSTLRVLGVLSYSVYLWHHLFSQPRDLFWCRFPQNVVFLLAAATASYLFVERPFLRLKNRLDQSPNDAASQSRAVPS
jgi:peptidoglycan/LPS O-acetylase OafA/YrhL